MTTNLGPSAPQAVIYNLVGGESLTTFRNLTATSYDTPLVGTLGLPRWGRQEGRAGGTESKKASQRLSASGGLPGLPA